MIEVPLIEALDGIYCGPAPLPGALASRWNLDPVVLAGLAAMAATLGRRRPGAAGVAVLALIFVSPLCALSSALFSARAVHHVLLVAVAAPLVAAALPRATPVSGTAAFAVATGALWVWHVPALYDLALSNHAVYWAMQATLFLPALAFWRAVLSPGTPATAGLLLVTAGFVQMALLGAVLTFAPAPLYAIHLTAPLAWGLSPLADQQLAGLLMWVPAGLPFAVVGGVLARRGWAAGGGARA
jgi:putative membrane protein